MKQIIPTEQQEAEKLADYLRLKGFLFSHIPNETFTKNWGTKMKNKRAGVNRGIPDYIIILPANKIKKQRLLFCELKRKKKSLSVLSEEQKKWIEELNKCDELASVFYGADEVIDYIETYLKI